MAQQPIDYSINLPGLNPAQSVLQGMAVGQGLLDTRAQGVRQAEFERMAPMRAQLANLELADAQRKDQMAQQALALDAAARESAAVRAAQVAEARQRLLSGNPTADQIQRASVEFPELSASLQGWLKTASDAEKQTRAQQANTGFSLLANGKSEEAAAFYDAEAQKYEAAGLGKEAQGMRNMAEMARSNPAAAQMFSGLTAGTIDPKWAENATKIGTFGAEVRKAEAGADKTAAEAVLEDARAKQAAEEFGLKNKLTRAQIADIYNTMKNRDAEAKRKADEASGVKTPADVRKTIAEVDTYAGNITRNIDKVIAQVRKTGTFELTGPEGKILDQLLTEIATDQAKLMDPGSVARESEVEAMKKNLIDTGFTGLLTTNKTAIQVMEALRGSIAERKAQAYKARGIEPPGGAGTPSFATKYE